MSLPQNFLASPTHRKNNCCVFWPANACLRMVQNNEKHSKMMKKLPFPSCAWEAHVRRMKNKNPNEQPAFRCQPDFGSHSQSLTNKLFSSVSSCALHEPLVHMMVKVLFSSFLNVFDHAYECASMHALVEIHKKQLRSKSGSFYFLIHFNHSNPD